MSRPYFWTQKPLAEPFFADCSSGGPRRTISCLPRPHLQSHLAAAVKEMGTVCILIALVPFAIALLVTRFATETKGKPLPD
jgi:hypothetical protein